VRRWLARLLPAGFRGQVAGILLLGLALSQVLAAVLYVVLLPEWQRELRPGAAVSKLESTVRLIESLSVAERPAFARLLSEPGYVVRYEPSLTSPLPELTHNDSDWGLQQQLAGKLGRAMQDIEVASASDENGQDVKHIRVLLRDGGVLQVSAPVGREHRLGLVEQAALFAFFLFVLVGLWAWLTWTVNDPLTRFARAAERVGVDIHSPSFPEQGPSQLRRAIRAFNEMQVRVLRLLTDRTRMLGAISHDLRTPLTRLRLRIETGGGAEDKAKMLTDIESMEAMLGSSLAFVRGVEEAEAPETVDMDLLLQTVCDTVSDLGGEVSYEGPARCRYRCRPQAMQRALTNVIGNAAKYGRRVQVSLDGEGARGLAITVDDDGPGIPDIEKSKVFEPFYRTPAARDHDSQGMGLGLSIARSIILAHGGAIELSDVLPHGLRVRIQLPETSPT
jgi:signal transduction histidine kinase